MTFVAMKEPTRTVHKQHIAAIFMKAIMAQRRDPEALISSDIDLPLAAHEVPIDPENVEKFSEITGHRTETGTLPPNYFFRLAYPVMLMIGVDDAFPFRPFGVLHRKNRTDILKPVPIDPKIVMKISSQLRSFEATETSTLLNFDTSFSIDGEIVATMATTGADTSKPRSHANRNRTRQAPDMKAEWSKAGDLMLPLMLGMQYAPMSEDWNTGHIPYSRILSDPKRHTTLQGNCSSSRMLAHAAGDPVNQRGYGVVETEYRAPVPLPSLQQVWVRDEGKDRHIALFDPKQNRITVEASLSGPG